MAKRKIYMDYSATTPVDPQVVEAMASYWSDVFGNTSSAHAWGQEAAAALENARERIARILGCRPAEIVFTASGTEADNLALRGVAWAARRSGRGHHIVTTPIEHHAVEATVEQLHHLFGFEVTLLPVDGYGLVDPDEVRKAIRPDTALVSIITASNEVGTVQPIPEIAAVCREYGIPFHTDAVQAAGRMALNVDTLGVDLLALSAHKFYGPKGVGLLYIRRGLSLIPPITGGGHEGGRRPGTVNLPGIAGMATALELAEAVRDEEAARLARLRDRLIEGILASIPDVRLTGHPTRRLPHLASFAIRGVEGASVVIGLDLEGIAASSGAACSEGEVRPSPILKAMGFPPEWAIGALRLSLGRYNTEEDVDAVLDALPRVVAKLRSETLTD
ncbi:MAG: cysteine desulfurase [Anaerolineae bacterium]|nr:cysteine desulfurase [Anaerolineae bacterium]